MVIEIIKSIVFGIVEGITEWLPISSTGHMILLEEFLRLDVSAEFWDMYLVVIQLGAIAAVVVMFWHKLWPFSRDHGKNVQTWRLWGKVILAVLPSAVVGLLLDDWMTAHLYNYVTVAAALIFYGVLYIVIERRRGEISGPESAADVPLKTAVVMGLFQCLALIPGTSRSGSTILGGMLAGVTRTAAAEFSFFLAIPTMAGASLLKGVKFVLAGTAVSGTELAVLAVGCVTAFLVSAVVIKALMDYVRRHTFAAFGVYRVVLGALVAVYFICA